MYIDRINNDDDDDYSNETFRIKDIKNQETQTGSVRLNYFENRPENWVTKCLFRKLVKNKQ